MKLHHLKTIVPLLATVGFLTACGGGGDQAAGSPTVFSLVPNTLTFKPPAGTATGACTGGGTGQIFIYGGAAPYQINNTAPAYVTVSTNQVTDRGGSFTVTVTGGCLSAGQIVVVDNLNHIVTLTVTNSPA